MDFDKNKVDEYTLTLLYLVTHERREGLEHGLGRGSIGIH